MSSLPSIIVDLALILIVAGAAILLFKKLKQPMVLGYIVAGFIIGPHFSLFATITDPQNITIWGDIGIIFLLFALGLEFNFRKLKKVGVTGFVTALTELIGMFFTGFLIGKLFGWSQMNCLFLGGMVSISSTTIIIKAFEDLHLKGKKFTNIVVGVLVVEDLVAIMLLVIFSTIGVTKTVDSGHLLFSIFKLIFFLVIWFVLGIYLLPTLLKGIRKLMTPEILLIVSLGLCLGMVVLASAAGFSASLGAFVMGSILSETIESAEIHRMIKPIKNLFVAVFFVSVGIMVDPAVFKDYAMPVIVISLAVLILKTIFATSGVFLSGQTLKTSMQTGFSLSQIGEFSFIIATLGISMKVIDNYLYQIIVVVSVITTFLSPYVMKLANPAYNKLVSFLPKNLRLAVEQHDPGLKTVGLETDWKKMLKAYFSHILFYGIIIVAILLLSLRILLPFCLKQIENPMLARVVPLLVTLGILTPFLHVFVSRRIEPKVYVRLWSDRKSYRASLFIMTLCRYLLAVFCVTFLLWNYVSWQIGIPVGLVAMSVVIVMLSRFDFKRYKHIETRFLANLNQKSKHHGFVIPESLANDLHSANFEVSAQSALTGKTIGEVQYRENYGVNIVSIFRGEKRINIPGKDEYIFPGDTVVVVGTDEQLSNFATLVETQGSLFAEYSADEEMDLYQLVVEEGSNLIGKSIRDSEIRDIYKCLVIGIERVPCSIMNPESSTILNCNDVLWIVGNKKKVLDLAKNKKREDGN